jgi:hypothetical protein
MAEYAGYISNRGNIVDFEGAAAGLSGAVKNVDQARKQRRKENDQIARSLEEQINDTEQPKNQTLNTFVLDGAMQAKAKKMDWMRELKQGGNRADFLAKTANLEDYWNNLATVTKSLDQRLTQAMERQQVGEDGTLPPASQIEAEMQMYFGGLSNLKNKNLVIEDDGRVSVGKYDDDGKLVSTEDIKYINNPANIVFNRTDLTGQVAAGVKNWASWQQGRVTDMRLNPKFKLEKNRLINTLTSSPRSAASILVDNTDGEYQVYFGEEDKQQRIAALKQEAADAGQKLTDAEAEAKLIRMRQDENGDYQPTLTDAQMSKAKEITDNAIEAQVGREVEPAPQQTGGPDFWDMFKYQQVQDNSLRGYIAAREGWTKGDFSGLMQGYEYEPEGGDDGSGKPYQVKVYKVLTTPAKTGSGEYQKRTLVKTAKNPEGLSEFAFDGDPNTSLTDYTTGRQMFYGQGLQNTERFQTKGKAKQSNVPSASKADWKANGWSEAQIKQAVKEGKIKVI